MSLAEQARSRLEGVRELEPTTNSELRDRWGMDSGKEVARYLDDELGEHTYRNDNSKICAVDPVPDTTEPDAGGEETAADAADGPSNEHEDVSPSPTDEEPETPATDGPDDPSDDVGGSVATETRDVLAEQTSDAPGEGKNPLVAGPSNGIADDNSRPETTSNGDPADASSDEPVSLCPSCGGAVLPGDDFEELLREQAQGNKNLAEFVRANEGADPDRACIQVWDCGYYVEDGEAKIFEALGDTAADTASGTSGGSGWLGTAISGVALATAASVLAKVVGTGDEEDKIRAF